MNGRTFNIVESVNRIVSPAYLVGGAVRDAVTGGSPKDYDFATPLCPDEVEYAAREAGRHVYTVGKRFGTIGFKVWDGVSEWVYVEVTTFRTETAGRKPEVHFVESLQADLSRRDFTMNALALRWDGRIIDPFGGQDDLENDLIRAVGNPTLRFKEDPLRMLRAARFVSQLGMFIEPDTFKSMKKHAHKILEVSKERWVQEMDKLLMGAWVPEGIEVLFESGLMAYMLPELAPQFNFDQKSDHHKLPLHEHTICVVGNTHRDLNVRWAALLHDVGKPAAQAENKRGSMSYIKHELIGAELAESIALRLKFSNERRNAVRELVRHHMDEDSPLRKADQFAKGV